MAQLKMLCLLKSICKITATISTTSGWAINEFEKNQRCLQIDRWTQSEHPRNNEMASLSYLVNLGLC